MAFEFPTSISGFGPLDKIVEDFSKSLNNIFGLGGSGGSTKLSTIKNILAYDGSGHKDFDAEKWTGNTNRKGTDKLRYGFRIIDLSNVGGTFNFSSSANSSRDVYYLDIPPQAISQKEVFATNITATRRGVNVESEGVVFKDLVIAGTTGVFPGPRDGYGGEQANYTDFTQPPAKAGGVQKDGTAKASKVVSGYAEFLGLRAFFLRYSQEKIKNKGNKFLVFINEKDQQALVVEPLEFTMERNSKNPMQYQYRIVFKCITTLDALFTEDTQGARDVVGLLNDVVNVSRNAVAAIQQFRAAVGATNRLVQSISQEIDKTFIQPLRMLGTALNDVAEARSNILAVPAVLQRNLNESVLSIQENRFTTTKKTLVDKYVVSTSTSSGASANNAASVGKVSTRGSTDTMTSNNLLDRNKAENFVNSTINALETSSVTPMSKSFVLNMRDQAQALADDIADVVNLGNASYDTIKHRSVAFIPNPLKAATSNEFILLGATLKLVDVLNQVLATNNLFLINIDATFENDQNLLKNIANVKAPSTVKEIVIMSGDTLEKISLREYGTVTRWVELAVLNNLKYPYISDTKADGVKAYGDKLLVGN